MTVSLPILQTCSWETISCAVKGELFLNEEKETAQAIEVSLSINPRNYLGKLFVVLRETISM